MNIPAGYMRHIIDARDVKKGDQMPLENRKTPLVVRNVTLYHNHVKIVGEGARKPMRRQHLFQVTVWRRS